MLDSVSLNLGAFEIQNIVFVVGPPIPLTLALLEADG